MFAEITQDARFFLLLLLFFPDRVLWRMRLNAPLTLTPPTPPKSVWLVYNNLDYNTYIQKKKKKLIIVKKICIEALFF